MQGTIGNVDQPVWHPLFELVGEKLGGDWFMWMYEVRVTSGRRVHAYKHRWSRRYLFVDGCGDTYEYTRAGRYRSVEPEAAVALAFRPWRRQDVELEETLEILDMIDRIEIGQRVQSGGSRPPAAR